MGFAHVEWSRRQDLKTPALRLALLELCRHANDDGRAWPSVTTLAGLIGVSQRHARRLLRDLETAGLVRPERRVRPNGSTTSTIYLMLMSPAPDKSARGADMEAQGGRTPGPPAPADMTHGEDAHVPPGEDLHVRGGRTPMSAPEPLRELPEGLEIQPATQVGATAHQNPVREQPQKRIDGKELELVHSPVITAQTIVAEWLDWCGKRPPGHVIGQLSKLIKQMLDEGVNPDDVRRGTAQWTHKGLHPSTLPSVVNEVMNGGTRSRTDQNVMAALDRAAALEAQGL